MGRSRGRGKLAAGLCGLLIAAVLAAGCSNSGASQSGADGSGKPLRIGVNAFATYYLWYVAEAQGFFDKHGVDVELVWFPSYSVGVSAFNSGNLDANSQSLSDTLVPFSRGIEMQVPLIIDHSNGADGILVKNGIETFEDLKGKTVATELGTISHFFMLSAFERFGLQESDVTFTNMTISDAGVSFIAGNLDAAVLWEPFLSTAVNENKGELLFTSKEMPGVLMDAIPFRKDVIEKRPDDVKKVIAAWFDAVDFFRTNREEAIAIMAPKAEISEEAFAEMIDGVEIYDRDDNLNAAADSEDYLSVPYNARKVGEFFQKVGYLETMPDIGELYNPTIIQALAAEAAE